MEISPRTNNILRLTTKKEKFHPEVIQKLRFQFYCRGITFFSESLETYASFFKKHIIDHNLYLNN